MTSEHSGVGINSFHGKLEDFRIVLGSLVLRLLHGLDQFLRIHMVKMQCLDHCG